MSANVVNSNTTININSNPVLTVNGGPGVFANTNTFAGFGAGTRIVPTGTSGTLNAFFGYNAGFANVNGTNNALFGPQASVNNAGSSNSIFGGLAGQLSTTGNFNTFLGALAGTSNRTEDNNTIVGARADDATGVTNGTALGFRAQVTQSNSLVLGSINGVNGASADTDVGIGTTAPQDRLDVNGIIRVSTLGAAGSTALCQNSFNQISTCSSSLRYKTNIAPFGTGLNLIRQLRPISYDWKAGGMHDVGFGAEDVAKINPLFVTYNKEGQVEGVKYDRLSTVFVNAFNEQQTQITQQQQEIERQQRLLKQQQTQIESLQKLICLDHPTADVCTASPR